MKQGGSALQLAHAFLHAMRTPDVRKHDIRLVSRGGEEFHGAHADHGIPARLRDVDGADIE